MELQTHDLRELAEFFAKRFPRKNDRRLLVDQLRLPYKEAEGLPPIQSWMGLLEIARERRALTRLGQAAIRLRPYDENLGSMTSLLERSEGGSNRATMQMMGMAMAAVLAVGSTWAAAQSLNSPTQDDERTSETANVQLEAPVTESLTQSSDAPSLEAPDSALDSDVVVAELETTAEPLLEASAEPETVKVALNTNRPMITGGSAYFDGRCTTSEDGLLGYWYAGEAAPGAAGEIIVMPNSVNVRSDYPDRHNDYDARTKVRCMLNPGDQVHLTEDPILVPGNRYWVPIHNGDLLHFDA